MPPRPQGGFLVKNLEQCTTNLTGGTNHQGCGFFTHAWATSHKECSR